MAKYDFLLHQPEIPLTEKWLWQTDAITSDDGGEQVISLASTPKRSFSGTFAFDSVEQIRRHQASMFTLYRSVFMWPAWQDFVVLKAPRIAGATALPCNTRRSDFRQGAPVLIVGPANDYELKTVDSVTDDGIVVTPPLTKAFNRRARIVPVLLVYTGDNAPFVRTPGDKGATATFNHLEYTPPSPFILDAHKMPLALLDTVPILNRRGEGTQFDDALVTGIEVTDYGAQASLRSRWKNGVWMGNRSFTSHRYTDPDDWRWWRTFADACRGGAGMFYLPTWRSDFDLVVAGGVGVTLKGHEYVDHYWLAETHRGVMLLAPDGRQHFARVVNAAYAGADDGLTIAPGLPAGDWAGSTISLLLQSRIADDTITAQHSGMETLVTFNVRTTY